MYQLSVSTGSYPYWNKRKGKTIQLMDVGEHEPKALFFGDLDPKTRHLQGEITLISPEYSMGLFGYRFYATQNGESNLPLVYSDQHPARWDQFGTPGAPFADPQFVLNLDRHCPPDSTNNDWAAHAGSTPTSWRQLVQAPCGNDNPYSPVCVGKSCAFVKIMSGGEGEFYLSRFDNIVDSGTTGAAELTGSGRPDDQVHMKSEEYAATGSQRNYSHNEYAQIYLPKSGWLTPILMDVNHYCDAVAKKYAVSLGCR